MKRITDISYQWNELCWNLFAQWSELEALDARLSQVINANEEELWRKVTLKAYEPIQLEIQEAEEKTQISPTSLTCVFLFFILSLYENFTVLNL